MCSNKCVEDILDFSASTETVRESLQNLVNKNNNDDLDNKNVALFDCSIYNFISLIFFEESMTTSSVDGAVGDERDDVVDTVEVVVNVNVVGGTGDVGGTVGDDRDDVVDSVEVVIVGVDDVGVVGGTVASNNGDVELVGGVSDTGV